MNSIRGNKFIHEMLPTALICQSKAPKVFMQSDMLLGLRSSMKKVTVIVFNPGRWALSTLPYGTKAQSLRRPVDLIKGRTALQFSVIYDHHW